ncbi:hypothetical protein IE53DRAFT_389598 [Violaceomyces palustris]|uniref:Uncharacterized protein n=1 Tax=Violaceomyces palustris TaxID=1673888 RepID=A0ACD0NQZ6_9BASI|nr:hypothetical protein IE53DRAFT_389598 [Violaceomyces palustris]
MPPTVPSLSLPLSLSHSTSLSHPTRNHQRREGAEGRWKGRDGRKKKKGIEKEKEIVMTQSSLYFLKPSSPSPIIVRHRAHRFIINTRPSASSTLAALDKIARSRSLPSTTVASSEPCSFHFVCTTLFRNRKLFSTGSPLPCCESPLSTTLLFSISIPHSLLRFISSPLPLVGYGSNPTAGDPLFFQKG